MKEIIDDNFSRHKSIIATHTLFTEGDKTLLLLRKNTGYVDGYYGLVAGTVEPNETVIEATIREPYAKRSK